MWDIDPLLGGLSCWMIDETMMCCKAVAAQGRLAFIFGWLLAVPFTKSASSSCGCCADNMHTYVL